MEEPFDFPTGRRRPDEPDESPGPPGEEEPPEPAEGPGPVEEEPGAGPPAEIEPEGDSPAEAPARGPRIRSETLRRALWAVPWIAFAIFIVVVGGDLFMVAMIGLAFAGLRELFRMTERARPLMAPAFIGVAGMIVAARYGAHYQVLMAFAFMFPLLFAFAAARAQRPEITVSVAITVLGAAWIGLAFAHAMLLRDLPDHGAGLLVDVLVATFAADTCAYLGGRLFGSRRIAPRISPNKTLEGLVAGFIGATLGFWFAGLYQDWLSGTQALIGGAAIGVLAPCGDLFVSMIKRDLDVKDTGRLFGPHGGLLDRLDAVLFTVVVGYYLSVAFVG